MKNRLAALLAVALLGCGTEGEVPTSVDSSVTPEASAYDDILWTIGLEGGSVVDLGDRILVGGDVAVRKQYLDSLRQVRRKVDGRFGPSQYRTTNLVTNPGKIQTIKVNLSNLTSHPNLRQAALEAMTEWNAITASYIRLVEGSPADITFATYTAGSGTFGYGSWPESGNPGATITVNTQFSTPVGSTSLGLRRNMAHEFGHNIGLRHTNWKQVDGFNCTGTNSATAIGAVQIPYTPGSGNDAASIMNGCTANQAWIGFSFWDKVSAVSLYPIPAPSGVTVSYSAGGVPTLSWQPVAGAQYYRVVYWIDSYWTSPEYGSMLTYGTLGEVGTTTGTSFTDWSKVYVGPIGNCYYYYESVPEWETRTYAYGIEAVLANGTSRALIGADVFTCPEI